MRRSIILATAIVATLLVGSTSALAASVGNPHIVGTPTATVSGNSLILSASVAGLGNVETATFDLVGSVDVYSQCFTRSGNKPAADNKRETISVNDSEPFDVVNGRTNATFTVTPLSSLQCPKGQVLRIVEVTYNLALMYMGDTLYTFTSS